MHSGKNVPKLLVAGATRCGADDARSPDTQSAREGRDVLGRGRGKRANGRSGNEVSGEIDFPGWLMAGAINIAATT